MEQMKNIVNTNVESGYVTNVNYVYGHGNRPRTSSIYNNQTNINVRNASLAKSKTNMLGKIRIICFFSVLSLLMFLFIYNFIAMASLNASIAGLESTIISEQTQINDLKSQIKGRSSESSIIDRAKDAGFSSEAKVNDEILIVDVPKIEINEVQAQTNWFNEFCKFVSSVFGG